MYYIADGKAYADAGKGKVKGIDVTAKDKVVEVRELESVTVTAVGGARNLPAGAVGCSLDELVAKFHVSESNPLLFSDGEGSDAKADAKAEENSDAKAEEE